VVAHSISTTSFATDTLQANRHEAKDAKLLRGEELGAKRRTRHVKNIVIGRKARKGF